MHTAKRAKKLAEEREKNEATGTSGPTGSSEDPPQVILDREGAAEPATAHTPSRQEDLESILGAMDAMVDEMTVMVDTLRVAVHRGSRI
jgi:hypothetical protein